MARNRCGFPISYLFGVILNSSKYRTNESSLYKKWLKFLKYEKLYGDYVIYLSYYDGCGVNPKNYRQLSNLCYNISKSPLFPIDWQKVFTKFAHDSIKWYNIKDMFLYKINNGYK